jgi:SecD/SecF fusion protein
MVVDNYVYTCPKVMSQIPNGRSSITGNFTKEEAEDLANLLNLHSLPAFKVIKVTITDEPK